MKSGAKGSVAGVYVTSAGLVIYVSKLLLEGKVVPEVENEESIISFEHYERVREDPRDPIVYNKRDTTTLTQLSGYPI